MEEDSWYRSKDYDRFDNNENTDVTCDTTLVREPWDCSTEEGRETTDVTADDGWSVCKDEGEKVEMLEIHDFVNLVDLPSTVDMLVLVVVI